VSSRRSRVSSRRSLNPLMCCLRERASSLSPEEPELELEPQLRGSLPHCPASSNRSLPLSKWRCNKEYNNPEIFLPITAYVRFVTLYKNYLKAVLKLVQAYLRTGGRTVTQLPLIQTACPLALCLFMLLNVTSYPQALCLFVPLNVTPYPLALRLFMPP
jgi:hypothetical protein